MALYGERETDSGRIEGPEEEPSPVEEEYVLVPVYFCPKCHAGPYHRPDLDYLPEDNDGWPLCPYCWCRLEEIWDEYRADEVPSDWLPGEDP